MVLACLSSDVLPPPSRLACASASALSGFDLDLLLTSTTCKGCMISVAVFGAGKTRLTPNRAKACSAMEKIIASDMLALSLPSKQPPQYQPPANFQRLPRSALHRQSGRKIALPLNPALWIASQHSGSAATNRTDRWR